MLERIVGAGLSGLLAAAAFPDIPILEREKTPRQNHTALLRFRSKEVAALTGIAFREVSVRKAIYSEGEFIRPSLRAANAYSLKVTGRLLNNRSIWNLEPATRYIAPEDFYDRLVSRFSSRICFGEEADLTTGRPTITTAPLPSTLESLDLSAGLSFDYSPITVARYRVRDCDLFQTIYFPDPSTSVYRASITADLLIIESVRGFFPHSPPELQKGFVREAFGIPTGALEPLETREQRYGKIAPIDDSRRRSLLALLSQKFQLYSLGRFATWRNVLLDDLVNDLAVIRSLAASDSYSVRIAAAGRGV